MTLQRSQGELRPLVAPIDELPAGVAALQPEAGALGKPPYAPGSAAAREAGRRGGAAKRGRTALADQLGLAKVFRDASFEAYRAAAESFARAELRHLEQTVGGGAPCGPSVRSFVRSAALQLAASRHAFDHGDVELGSRLADASRQNAIAGRELAARDAQARRRAPSSLRDALRPPERAGAGKDLGLDSGHGGSRARRTGAATSEDDLDDRGGSTEGNRP